MILSTSAHYEATKPFKHKTECWWYVDSNMRKRRCSCASHILEIELGPCSSAVHSDQRQWSRRSYLSKYAGIDINLIIKIILLLIKMS